MRCFDYEPHILVTAHAHLCRGSSVTEILAVGGRRRMRTTRSFARTRNSRCLKSATQLFSTERICSIMSFTTSFLEWSTTPV
jgi:hypothetical protein